MWLFNNKQEEGSHSDNVRFRAMLQTESTLMNNKDTASFTWENPLSEAVVGKYKIGMISLYGQLMKCTVDKKYIPKDQLPENSKNSIEKEVILLNGTMVDSVEKIGKLVASEKEFNDMVHLKINGNLNDIKNNMLESVGKQHNEKQEGSTPPKKGSEFSFGDDNQRDKGSEFSFGENKQKKELSKKGSEFSFGDDNQRDKGSEFSFGENKQKKELSKKGSEFSFGDDNQRDKGSEFSFGENKQKKGLFSKNQQQISGSKKCIASNKSRLLSWFPQPSILNIQHKGLYQGNKKNQESSNKQHADEQSNICSFRPK